MAEQSKSEPSFWQLLGKGIPLGILAFAIISFLPFSAVSWLANTVINGSIWGAAGTGAVWGGKEIGKLFKPKTIAKA